MDESVAEEVLRKAEAAEMVEAVEVVDLRLVAGAGAAAVVLQQLK